MSEKFYKSIEDISLYNWVKVNEGHLNYLQHNLDEGSDDEELNRAWDILFDNYLDERGLSKTYHKMLLIMKKKALHQCDYIITKDQFKLTEISIEEEKLRQLMQKDNVDISVQKTLIMLSKWIGYRLDWKVISLKEYYIIIEEYGKAN